MGLCLTGPQSSENDAIYWSASLGLGDAVAGQQRPQDQVDGRLVHAKLCRCSLRLVGKANTVKPRLCVFLVKVALLADAGHRLAAAVALESKHGSAHRR